MVVVLVFLLAVILGAVAIIATGRGAQLSDEPPDRPPPPQLPPDRLVDAVDVNRLRIPLALRGYRMEDVDRVLDRLAGELAERDRQIEALGQELLGGGLAPPEGRSDGKAQAKAPDEPAAQDSGGPDDEDGQVDPAGSADLLGDDDGQTGSEVRPADWLTAQYRAADQTDSGQHDEVR